eukprot:TRINITY_DN1882_c0_g1_i1.p1 TRINITY_DN1882_c0_g1~~TRINITY_DN1882_c0_g1_i1.p1  ORF type:complete len:398 (-),score=96.26 TRINITY_DN1882_c0_g1_i1:1532-2725(-)
MFRTILQHVACSLQVATSGLRLNCGPLPSRNAFAALRLYRRKAAEQPDASGKKGPSKIWQKISSDTEKRKGAKTDKVASKTKSTKAPKTSKTTKRLAVPDSAPDVDFVGADETVDKVFEPDEEYLDSDEERNFKETSDIVPDSTAKLTPEQIKFFKEQELENERSQEEALAIARELQRKTAHQPKLPRVTVEDIVKYLSAAKGQNLVVIDLKDKSDMASYMYFAGGVSGRHLRAIADEVLAELYRHERSKHDEENITLAIDGRGSDDWMIIDAGDHIIHFMTQPARDRYRLERKWSTARMMDLFEGKPDLEAELMGYVPQGWQDDPKNMTVEEEESFIQKRNQEITTLLSKAPPKPSKTKPKPIPVNPDVTNKFKIEIDLAAPVEQKKSTRGRKPKK